MTLEMTTYGFRVVETHSRTCLCLKEQESYFESLENIKRGSSQVCRGERGWLSDCQMGRGNETETLSACGNNGSHLITFHTCTCILKITYSITLTLSLDNHFPCQCVPVTHSSDSDIDSKYPGPCLRS